MGWFHWVRSGNSSEQRKSKHCQLKIIINKIHGTCHNSRVYRKKNIYSLKPWNFQGSFSLMRLDKTTCIVKYSCTHTHTNLTWPTNLWERVYFSISITDALKMVNVGSLSPFCSCYSSSYYYHIITWGRPTLEYMCFVLTTSSVLRLSLTVVL